MAPKVTLKEIAQEVGLSPSAVSLVLNDRPCRISEENRRRIKEVAARKRYVPNQIARSLVMQQSRTFGLIVPNIESRFFSSLARNLEIRCRERGYALFIMNSDVSSEHEDEIVRLLVNRGVDGLILVTAHELDADEQLVESLSTLPVPLVMVDRFIDGVACDRVRFDSELGGFLATDCLLQHGHTRIACLVNTSSHTGRARLTGYRRALESHGVAADDALVFRVRFDSELGGFLATDCLLQHGHTRIACLVNTSSHTGRARLTGYRRAHESHGVAADDALVFESDYYIADGAAATESKLADNAMELLLKRVGEQDGHEFEDRVLAPRLVCQASVAPLDR